MLEGACEDLIRYLRQEIQTQAERSGVPDDFLEGMLVDWLVSDAMGIQRTPSALFIPDNLAAPPTPEGDAKLKGVLPPLTVCRLTAQRKGAACRIPESRRH